MGGELKFCDWPQKNVEYSVGCLSENALLTHIQPCTYLLKHRREYTTGIIELGCGREADKARGGAECLIRLRDHILVQ